MSHLVEAPVLTVRDLRVAYQTDEGTLWAVKGATLAVPSARIVGVVGESGSGKSTIALAVMGALRDRAHVTGEVRYRGENLLEKPERALRRLWGRRLAMVFQDPTSTLDPVIQVGQQLVEVLVEHERLSRHHARARMLDLFDSVQLPNPPGIAGRYPHQLSGGQQQRVSIAIALACDPDLLILDEPTTGLDVTTESRILDLVDSLRQRTTAGILYISHNLGVVARLADEVAVMYAGEIVEHGPVSQVLRRPRHPYTVALLDCLPRVDRPPSTRLLPAIEGMLPEPWGAKSPAHCQFAPRCSIADERCHLEPPALITVTPSHHARCFRWEQVPLPGAVRMSAGPISASVATARSTPICEVIELVQEYVQEAEWAGLFGHARTVRAVDGVSLTVAAGETLAIVGESGSGKTTIARSIVGLLQPTSGEIRVNGHATPRRPAAWPRTLRRRLQIVFQNPDLTLNPRRTVLETIARPLVLFGLVSRSARRQAAACLLEAVGLGAQYLDVVPGQLSGGQRQRVAIARAFASRPDVVVCDEPTSALDASVQATVLNLLGTLQSRERTSYLFISHDLSVVRHVADRVAVLYSGHIVESGRTEDVFAAPYHPYTEALLSAVPSLAAVGLARSTRVEGPVGNPAAPPSGCAFHPRCPRKLGQVCEREAPPVLTGERGHAIMCHIPYVELLRLQVGVAEPMGGLHQRSGQDP